MAFTKVAVLSDFRNTGVKRVEINGVSIMILKLGNVFHALDSTCTHEDADLSRGIISGEYITCPLHLSRFSIRTGEVDNPPAEEPLHTYDVKTVGDDILVDL